MSAPEPPDGLFPGLNMSDSIALLALVVAFASMVVATFVAYHIARAQGWLRRHELLATFGITNKGDPSVVVLNLDGLPRKLNVAPVIFAISNGGKFSLSNVAVQFNSYPRMDIARLAQFGTPREGVEMYSIGDHDIYEYRVGSLAPDEGTYIGVPWVFDPSRLSQEPSHLGRISAYVTHDNGRRIIKNIEVGVMFEQEFSKRYDEREPDLVQTLSGLVESITRKQVVKIRAYRALVSAIFNTPFAHESWIAYEARFISANEQLALDRTIAIGTQPRIADGVQGLIFLGGARKKYFYGFPQFV